MRLSVSVRRWSSLVVIALIAASCGGGETTGDTAATSTTATTVGTTTTTLPANLGIEWSRVDDPGGALGGPEIQVMHGVAVAETGALVAVGRDGDRAAVWLSEDGFTWEQVPYDEAVLGGEIGEQEMYAITQGPQGLTVVGRDFAFGAAWLLAVGSLVRVPHNVGIFGGSPNQSMQAVAAAGPGLVAVGFSKDPLGGLGTADAVVWTSYDGLLWQRLPHSDAVFGGDDRGGFITTDQMMFGVTAGGPGVVAVGEDDRHPAVWTSSDGFVWSAVPHDEDVFGGSGRILDVVAGGPGLVAVGHVDGIAAVWTSEDGLTWTRLTGEGAGFGGYGSHFMQAVAVGGPGLVAIGGEKPDSGFNSEPMIWTSEDGLTWRRAPDLGFETGDSMIDVIEGGPGMIAVGYGNAGEDQWDAAVWVSPPSGG